MSTANRGKVAEGKLQKEFEKLNLSRSDFCFERIYDARSSMGKSSCPRSGDFLLFYQGRNILVECKEVDHSYRLPRANYPLDQRARGKKRALAGSECWVCIYHTPDKLWRILPLAYFGTETTGSWDFRAFETCDILDVIEKLLCHK